ncbi:FUSC family protein, partial [Pseudomonas stutzeri]|nr:FUSC family protein [Stutzerimonas stutzeri]
MKWQDLPDIAWGAFSALFVVRASVEGTIGEATGRILGALIGIALGVSLVLLTNFAQLAPGGG